MSCRCMSGTIVKRTYLGGDARDVSKIVHVPLEGLEQPHLTLLPVKSVTHEPHEPMS